MNKTVYTKFSNDRSSKLNIRTDIIEDEKGRRRVYKTPYTEKANAHIEQMRKNSKLLEESYKNSRFAVNRCTREGNKLVFAYISGPTLEEQADALLEQNDLEGFDALLKDYCEELRRVMTGQKFSLTKEFCDVFGRQEQLDGLVCAKVTNIDLILNNIIVNQQWNVIDYEWTFAFPIPVNYVIYRALHYYIEGNTKRNAFSKESLYQKAGLQEEELLIYADMERQFQAYIEGEHASLNYLYPRISPGELDVISHAKKNRMEEFNKRVRIFPDRGLSFSSDDFFELEWEEGKEVTLDFITDASMKRIRIDPGEVSCVVRLKDMTFDQEPLLAEEICKDGWVMNPETILFLEEDPQIIIQGFEPGIHELKGELFIEPAPKSLMLDFMQERKSLQATQQYAQERQELLEEDIEELHKKMHEAALLLDKKMDAFAQIDDTKLWGLYRKQQKVLGKENPLAWVRKDLNGRYSTILFAIDLVKYHGTDLIIQGWAADKEEGNVKIRTRDGNGKLIPSRIARYKREDVNEIEGFDLENHTGFHVFIKKKALKTKRVILEFENHEGFVSKEIEVESHIASNKEEHRHVYQGNEQDLRISYDEWIRGRFPTYKMLKKQRKQKFAYNPLISVIIPLYNTPIQYLDEILHSILDQTYSNIQLCLADGSTDDAVEDYIKASFPNESRILYKRLSENRGISENTNEALKMATGDFIMLSDHDDVVTLDACYEMVKAMNEDSEIDVIYTDEDKITWDGISLFDPHFKPDYNIDLLRSNNYICHIFVVRKSIVDEIGEFRSEYDGAQDYDFILRCVEKARKVHHIDKILYHWRSHPGSTAGDPTSKMYAYKAGERAVQAHYDRLGIDAKVTMTEYFGRYRSVFAVQGEPLVSILIPNKDHIKDLKRTIDSIYQVSTYRNFEIIIIENNSETKEIFQYYESLKQEHENIQVVMWEKEFNYSAINNYGAGFAKGEYLLLLNNDMKVISPDWMEEMLGYCQRSDVGICGAKLLYEDDTIQHAGVVIGLGGAAGHVLYKVPRNVFTYAGKANSTQDLSAVTAACMMTKKSVYEQVGGLDESFCVAFNDVDYCLKVREKGLLVVFDAFVELYHYESKTRGSDMEDKNKERFEDETNRFKEKWPLYFSKGDPYYNVNLTLKSSDCEIRREE